MKILTPRPTKPMFDFGTVTAPGDTTAQGAATSVDQQQTISASPTAESEQWYPQPEPPPRPRYLPRSRLRQMEQAMIPVMEFRELFDAGNDLQITAVDPHPTQPGGKPPFKESETRFHPVRSPQLASVRNRWKAWQDAASGKWLINETHPHLAHRTYKFVQPPGLYHYDGNTTTQAIIVLRSKRTDVGHYSAARGGAVEFAGWVTFKHGLVIDWNDGTGHFECHSGMARLCALPYEKFRSSFVAEHIQNRGLDARDGLPSKIADRLRTLIDPERLGEKRYFTELAHVLRKEMRRDHPGLQITRRGFRPLLAKALNLWRQAGSVVESQDTL